MIEKNNRGFTLIEIVITLGILIMMINPLYSLLSYNVVGNTQAQKMLVATELAQKYMEEGRIHLQNKQGTELDFNYKVEVIKVLDYSLGNKLNPNLHERINSSQIKDNNLRIKANGIYMGQSTLITTIDPLSEEIHLGIIMDEDKEIYINNETQKAINIYKIKDNATVSNITINLDRGILKVYTVNEDEDTEKNQMYKIQVRISKNNKELVNIVTFKTIN